MIRHSRVWRGALSAAAVVAMLAPGAAFAEVEREGNWPASDPNVTLDLEGVPRSEALNKLAKAAGWSIVVHAPRDNKVSLHVTNQPADKVLDLLLADGSYVAHRDNNLIAISPDEPGAPPARPTPATPPVPPAPPALPGLPQPPGAAPPVPPPPPAALAPRATPDDESDDEGLDRTVTGGSLRIEKGEVVHDVTVMGGNLDVWGTVTGDLAVMGGNVHVHRGARVRGDASAIGGKLTIETEAAIDGDVRVLGGALHRDNGAKIGGEVHDGVAKIKAHKKHHGGSVTETAAKAEGPSKIRSLARDVVDAVNGAALLFVFGSVLLALAPSRMDQLKVQIASRPMRSFATGIVSLIGGAAMLAAICVTIIGIPVAFVLAVLAVLATLAGVCSVLETVGAALLGHRTKNPYVHLAFGGLLFLIGGAIPYVGALVKLAVFFTAIGAVVATRAAGLLPARFRGGSPYRDAPVT
jgi:hypothetical protein